MATPPKEFDYTYKTEIKTQKITCSWVIKNIDKFLNSGKVLKSAKFCNRKIMPNKWHLILKLAENNYISLYAVKTGEECSGNIASIKASVLSFENIKFSGKVISNPGWDLETCTPFEYPKFISKDILAEITQMNNNTLELFIEMKLSLYIAQNHHPYLEKKPSALSNIENFESLFTKPLLSDVILYVSKKCSIYAHKAILGNKSPFFLQAFASEQHMKTYDLSDWGDLVIKNVVEWIYTGTLKNEEDVRYDDLLPAADKFKLSDLKLLIEVNLATTISLENVLDLFTSAQKYDAQFLMPRIQNFIKENYDNLAQKKDFEKIINIFV